MKGQIISISGPTVTVDLGNVTLYEQVAVGHQKLFGEVVRLEPYGAIVQVYEETRGLAVGEPAQRMNTPLTVRLAPGLLSDIFDGLQRPLTRLSKEFGPFIEPGKTLHPLKCEQRYSFSPLKKPGEQVRKGEFIGAVDESGFRHMISATLDGTISHIHDGEICAEDPVATLKNGAELFLWQDWPIRIPRPYKKKLYPKKPLITGQRIIDFLFPLARGGTAILPGGFGTGKTVLEQTIAKYAEVDIVVYVGCGERGNEMAEMLGEFSELTDPWTGHKLLQRTIMVANTSNMPVAARVASIYTAVTMAEYYRDMGFDVLLLADSISRWAEALREISSALEEMPGEEGYPTYLSSRIASFFARAGIVETLNGQTGSLSMILSVSPPGGDFTEPTTQSCLRNSGSFLMLDSDLANSRHFPAINWAQSYSLYEADVTDYCEQQIAQDWRSLRKKCQSLLQREEKLREVAEIVGTEGLQDSDQLLMVTTDHIRNRFLAQNSFTDDAFSTPEQTVVRIRQLIGKYEQGSRQLEAGIKLSEILKGFHS